MKWKIFLALFTLSAPAFVNASESQLKKTRIVDSGLSTINEKWECEFSSDDLSQFLAFSEGAGLRNIALNGYHTEEALAEMRSNKARMYGTQAVNPIVALANLGKVETLAILIRTAPPAQYTAFFSDLGYGLLFGSRMDEFESLATEFKNDKAVAQSLLQGIYQHLPVLGSEALLQEFDRILSKPIFVGFKPKTEAPRKSESKKCSTLAGLIMTGAPEHHILAALKNESNASMCTVAEQQVPVVQLLIEKGRLEILKKWLSAKGEALGELGYVRSEFVRALKAQDGDASLRFWIDSGLIDLHGSEIEF